MTAHGPAMESAPTRPLGERFLRADPAERQTLLLHLEDTGFLSDEPPWFHARTATIARLETAAREHNPREFARELQQSFGLSSRIAGEIAYDDSGEPLLIVAKASAMDAGVLLRILLLLNPAIGESVERVFTLYRLHQRIGLAAVAPIMTSWRDESRARPKARYQSLLAPDEAPSRTGVWDTFRTATEAQRERSPTRPGEAPAKRQGTT